MKKAIALILGLFIGGGLMIYSATRTVDLLQMTLPTGQKDMAYLALLAFDGGLIAWTLVFMFGAEGAWQRAISGIMITVCLAGVLIGFGADQILGARTGGLIDASRITSDFGLTATLATVGIIAANIAAIVFFHVMSPDNRRRMQEESFNDQIEKAAEDKSNEQIPALAAQLAIELTNSRMARLYAGYQNRIAQGYATGTGAPVIIDQAPQAATPATKKAQEPSILDRIKEGLSGRAADSAPQPHITPAAQPQTMAADGQPPEPGSGWHDLVGNAMQTGMSRAGLKFDQATTPERPTPSYTPPSRHEAPAPTPAAPAAISTEAWRLENAASDLARAERALGAPPNMQDGESLFQPYDPMAHWNDTRLENDLNAAQAAYNQAKANYEAASAPKGTKA